MRPTVVHLLGGLGFGGNETLCLQLVRHAPPEVANVVIYQDPARTAMARLFQDVPGLRLRCVATRGRSRPGVVWAVARELRALRPTAVLVYSFGVPHLLATAAARLAGVPTVCTHAGNPAPGSPDSRRKWRIVLALSRVFGVPVQACSAAVERSLRALGRLPRGSGAIANGCDVADIARRAGRARALRRRDGRLVIGMVARLDPIKDQATLIRAFAEVAKEHPQAELWLIGDGPRAGELRALAIAAGVAERVVFWGQRSDVPELLGQIDVFAFSTTEDEGFGIALIEAMAAGLPVVASDVPACREVLADGAAGILVPAGRSEPLAAALRALAQNAAERRHWSSLGHRHAATHHDVRRCADLWYRTLVPTHCSTGMRTPSLHDKQLQTQLRR